MNKRLSGIFTALALGTVVLTTQCQADNATRTTPATTDARDAQQAEIDRMSALYREILERIANDSVVNPDIGKIGLEGIQYMVEQVDPHSSFTPPADLEATENLTSGTFVGIGVEVEMKQGRLTVVTPIAGAPAELQGIHAKDVITHINGESLEGISLDDAVDKIRGELGTPVQLTVEREGADQPLQFEIIRGRVDSQPVHAKLLDGNIGYVNLSIFSRNATREMRRAVDEMKREAGGHLNGLVLDLRNDPGGLLTEAIGVADLYLDDGVIVTVNNRDQNRTETWGARRGDIIDGAPLVVLVNGGSASASEIVAGALQDNRRALIVGTQTYGKGSVQTLLPVSVGGNYEGELRLTTGLYITPSGDSIQGRGITPQVRYVDPDATVATDPKPHGEAALDGMIANPDTGADDQQTTATCSPAADANTTAAEEGLKRLRDANGNPVMDFALACAVEQIRSRPVLTVTTPVTPEKSKAIPAPAL